MKKSLFVILVAVIAMLSTMLVAERQYSEKVRECAEFERPSVVVIDLATSGDAEAGGQTVSGEDR